MALSVVLVGTLAPILAAANKGDALYEEARKTYDSFWIDEDQKAHRGAWLRLIAEFERVYREDPSSPSAVKAYYMAGKLSYHCYKYHNNREDMERGIKNFNALMRKYPTHSLADDAQYYLGELYRKDGKAKLAAYNYRLVIERYPEGDMGRDARQRLEQMLLWPMPAWLSSYRPDSTTTVAANNTTPTTGSSLPAPIGMVSSGRVLIKDIRHHSSGHYTRVIIYCKHKVQYSEAHYIKPTPSVGIEYPRLYIDIEDSRLAPGVGNALTVNDGLLLKVRAGQFTPNVVRVVLDIDAIDHDQTKVFPIEETDGDYRIVIDVSAPENKRSQAAVDPGIEMPRKNIRRIVIDPGHGGKDPGATGQGGLKEKDVVLNLALKARDMMQKNLGLDVRLTREKDIHLPLEERTAFANMVHIEDETLFISLHANAAEDRKARGIETYILDTTDDHSAKRLAALENRVSIDTINALQAEKGLIFMLFQKAKADESYQLALDIQKALVNGLRPKYSQIYDHGVREAPFFVLMGAKMPCVLVEVSFISNPIEEKRLKSQTYLTLLAQSLTNGIAEYMKRKAAITTALP